MRKLAFIKVGGLASGGVEKYLQLLAVQFCKMGHEVDYFYTDTVRFRNGWVHPGTVPERKKYLEDNDVKTIQVKVDSIDDVETGGKWNGTDLFDVFDDNRYDFVIGGSKGYSCFPFSEIKAPVIETIHGTDWRGQRACNYQKNILITDYQIDAWKSAGGDTTKTEVIYPLVEIPDCSVSKRKELGITNENIVFGLHQSNRPDIFSPIPLNVYKQIENDKTRFIMVGGSNEYKEQAQRLGLQTFISYPFQETLEGLHDILMSLDVYLHGRQDGEVCSASIIEAMYHNLPIVSHSSNINNGHKFQLEDCGFFCYNEAEYLEAAKNLLDDEFRRKIAIKTSKKYQEKFDFDSILNKWKQILK